MCFLTAFTPPHSLMSSSLSYNSVLGLNCSYLVLSGNFLALESILDNESKKNSNLFFKQFGDTLTSFSCMVFVSFLDYKNIYNYSYFIFSLFISFCVLEFSYIISIILLQCFKKSLNLFSRKDNNNNYTNYITYSPKNMKFHIDNNYFDYICVFITVGSYFYYLIAQNQSIFEFQIILFGSLLSYYASNAKLQFKQSIVHKGSHFLVEYNFIALCVLFSYCIYT